MKNLTNLNIVCFSVLLSCKLLCHWKWMTWINIVIVIKELDHFISLDIDIYLGPTEGRGLTKMIWCRFAIYVGSSYYRSPLSSCISTSVLVGNTTFPHVQVRHMLICHSRFAIVCSPYEPVHHTGSADPDRNCNYVRTIARFAPQG